ncbi:hypothetical protein [Ruegeria intermedia]|uniref:hypothetical protein n=1 Tax=Ruegeria intermedia TaxID=996115 RepID=UPI00122D3A35|nr:hypothetical protein [Ruegeria intermedia]
MISFTSFPSSGPAGPALHLQKKSATGPPKERFGQKDAGAEGQNCTLFAQIPADDEKMGGYEREIAAISHLYTDTPAGYGAKKR